MKLFRPYFITPQSLKAIGKFSEVKPGLVGKMTKMPLIPFKVGLNILQMTNGSL